MVNEKYNPIKKIWKGEFTWGEDFKKTFCRKNLEKRAFELSAIILGTGFYLHEPCTIIIGTAGCVGPLAYDYFKHC